MSDAADDLAEVLGPTFTLKDGHAFRVFYQLSNIHFEITLSFSPSGIYCSVSSATVWYFRDVIGAGIPL